MNYAWCEQQPPLYPRMAWERLKWASSRWSIPRLLLLARVLQVMGTLVTAVMNGYLLVYIHDNRLGLSGAMFHLEMLVCIALIYSGVVLLVLHTSSWRRSSSIPVVSVFVAGDVVFNGFMIAILSILASTGLPSNCYGLTRVNVEDGDARNPPGPGFETIRFGNGALKGELDRYCGLEQSFYFISAGLIFTYMLTVTLGVLRISELRWTSHKGDLFTSTDTVYQLNRITPKTQSPNPNMDLESGNPSRETIITPTIRTNPTLQTQGLRPSRDIRRDPSFREQAQSQPLPVSPVSAASPISQVSPISPAIHQHRSFVSHTAVPDTSIGGLMIDHSAESEAEAAMVTDGYRHRLQPGMPLLPPYSPSQSRGQFMDGHGDESNEMRLSEYVKGQTRAQDIKDSGIGL
ncbi:hypothetical protein M426DRAFT_326142 [Hypoxylon sp. CI-4A]|nr:hypothetical protein M426DRAFT_326142 [Hypoxylon sp. CI-4A]